MKRLNFFERSYSSSLFSKKEQDEKRNEVESRLARPPNRNIFGIVDIRSPSPCSRILVSEREGPLFRFPSHPASTESGRSEKERIPGEMSKHEFFETKADRETKREREVVGPEVIHRTWKRVGDGRNGKKW